MAITLSEYLLAGLLGLVSIVTILVVNIFSYSLKPKSYDDAIKELHQDKKDGKKPKKLDPKSPKKKKEKTSEKSKKDDEHEDEIQESQSRRISRQHSKIRRLESVRNEHVIFADEISADDEKHSPFPVDAEVEGILQNREEIPMIDLRGDEVVKNTFEEIQPLDDLQLRRKSLQITPASSQGNSKSGSRQDLSCLGIERFEEEDDESNGERKHVPTLKFAEKVEERLLNEENAFSYDADKIDVKKICKLLRKIEMADTEISQVIDIMLKKEEHNAWSSKKTKSMSTLAQLKKDVEEKQQMFEEANELANSLQIKLKNLRAEYAEEKSTLLREKREVEEANCGLKQSLKLAEESKKQVMTKLDDAGKKKATESEAKELREKIVSLEFEMENLKGKWAPKDGEDCSSEIKTLREKLRQEMDENKQLAQSVREQQGIIKAALRRIYPNMEVGEYCQEHQEWFDNFVAKMRGHEDGKESGLN